MVWSCFRYQSVENPRPKQRVIPLHLEGPILKLTDVSSSLIILEDGSLLKQAKDDEGVGAACLAAVAQEVYTCSPRIICNLPKSYQESDCMCCIIFLTHLRCI
jgi:hypothetical protein